MVEYPEISFPESIETPEIIRIISCLQRLLEEDGNVIRENLERLYREVRDMIVSLDLPAAILEQIAGLMDIEVTRPARRKLRPQISSSQPSSFSTAPPIPEEYNPEKYEKASKIAVIFGEQGKLEEMLRAGETEESKIIWELMSCRIERIVKQSELDDSYCEAILRVLRAVLINIFVNIPEDRMPTLDQEALTATG